MENLTNVQSTVEVMGNIFKALAEQSNLVYFGDKKFASKTLVDQDGNKHLIFFNANSSKEEDTKRRVRIKNLYNSIFLSGSICSERSALCTKNFAELDIPLQTELGSVDVVTVMSVIDLLTYFDSDLKLMSYTLAWMYR